MKIKVHPPILRGIEKALLDIFEGGFYADKVLERSFKQNPKWGGRDRRMVAECVYEVVRHSLLLHRLREKSSLQSPAVFLDLALIWMEVFDSPFEWPQSPFKGQKESLLKDKSALPDWEQDSFPEWLYEELKAQRDPKEGADLRQKLNQQAPVFIRVNSLKASHQEVQAQLEQEGFVVEAINADCLLLLERKNLFASQAFKKGFFEVQDLHSQQVVPLLDPQPGECVIDACAGAGGKTLHISSRMKNKGRVIALDIQERKLTELKKRARRAGAHNLEAKVIDSGKVIKRLKGRADRLLLDVPCSGLGVLRRNPDTKWKLTRERLQELEEIQAQILSEYSEMLKDGGFLLYATCSILPSENQDQVQKFLSSHKNFELIEEKEWLPGPKRGDGFYMALLQKKKFVSS